MYTIKSGVTTPIECSDLKALDTSECPVDSNVVIDTLVDGKIQSKTGHSCSIYASEDRRCILTIGADGVRGVSSGADTSLTFLLAQDRTSAQCTQVVVDSGLAGCGVDLEPTGG